MSITPCCRLENHDEARVNAIMRRHGRGLLRIARKASLCDDDAYDAYQRALEIYLGRLSSVDPKTEIQWLRVVVRNEALAIRRQRLTLLNADEVETDTLADDARGVEEIVIAADRVRYAGKALRGLKRDELRALTMKASGYSYAEIGERCGWTYTKVNRCITEGRKRFFELYDRRNETFREANANPAASLQS